ncbi:MAG: PBP1A family penicillin-binding protein, partial [Candidatus Pacebacteria bacterium]|nr:PBP1A family penicillin-binding protein [Candidatus Paceibacterota bacterium]
MNKANHLINTTNKIKDMLRGNQQRHQSKKKNWLTTRLVNVFAGLKKLVGRASFKKLFGSKAKKWQQAFWHKQKNKRPSKTSSQKTTNNPIVPGSFHDRHPRVIKFLKILFFPIINPWVRYGLILIFLASLAGLIYILRDLPSPRRLTAKENYAVSTQIFDRDGVLLYEIFADENRIPVSLSTLPPHLLQATIAIEDKNFHHHFGFDLEGITRAVISNAKGKPIQGGSTITQQLVKNALLTKERTIQRKAKEGILAIFTELLYSKEEILEMYLNYISYGGTAVGIQAASKQYFAKDATELTLAESALLAGLPKAPSSYSPFGSTPERAKQRQHEVLRRMVEDGYISELEAENAKSETLSYALTTTDIKAPHFVFYVRDWLYEKYGVETVEKGGLRVTTTLDLDLQEAAQASLSAEVAKLGRYRISNGAALITKPNTGEILAMIGSTDYFDTEAEGQVNVTLAERQPGSSIKPLTYATAFQEKTLNPGSILLDVPTCFEIPGQKPYCPKNYDGTFKGPVTVRDALGNSLNIPAVKALKTIGVVKFMEQTKKMGLTTWRDPSNYGLSITLGGGEVKMIDMAQAFSVLANLGVKVPLTPVLKIEDYRGKVWETVNPDQRQKDLEYLNTYDSNQKNDLKRILDQAPAYLVSHILQDNNARKLAFGTRSELVIPGQIVSAKTGTTNSMKDNWTIGYTPEFLVATWVGNNDGTPMSYVASGVTGATPIWNDLMSYV